MIRNISQVSLALVESDTGGPNSDIGFLIGPDVLFFFFFFLTKHLFILTVS